MYGGEGGIRTPGPRKGTLAFEASAIDHSATSPHVVELRLLLIVKRHHGFYGAIIIVRLEMRVTHRHLD